MTKDQKQLAEKVRKLYEPTEFIEVGAAFTLADSIAGIIDGTSKGLLPHKMQRHFNTAWKAYAKTVASEHKEVAKILLGDKRFEDVMKSAGCDLIIMKIAERVTEECGKIQPGVEIKVNIEDIFSDFKNSNFEDEDDPD